MKIRTHELFLVGALLGFWPSLSDAQVQRSALFAQAPGSPIGVAGGPSNVAIADMNHDGKPDIVVACGKSIVVLLGTGNGRFNPAPKSPLLVAGSPSEMAVGDVNDDGKLDIAFANHDSYGISLLLGDGHGSFVSAPNSPIVMRDGNKPHTHGLEMGDLNGDGVLDLVTVNNNDNDVSVAVGNGQGTFTRVPRSPFAVGQSPYPSTLGDVNEDGHLDIIATTTMTGPSVSRTSTSSRAITILFGDGRGDFRRSDIQLRTREPWCVAVGDVNGDARPDLISTHRESSPLTVLIGQGDGRFSEAENSPFDLGRSAWRVALVDVSGDGKADVLVAAGEGVRVMLGDGRGNFASAPHSPYPTGKGTWRLAVGDVNEDGKPDVVTSNMEVNSVSILLAQ